MPSIHAAGPSPAPTTLADDTRPTSPGHQRDTEPDLDASGKRCLVTLSPSKHRSAVVPTARMRSPRRQIPIGHLGDINALPTRGFVPWRLSNAGRIQGADIRRRKAGIRNPSQMPTLGQRPSRGRFRPISEAGRCLTHSRKHTVRSRPQKAGRMSQGATDLTDAMICMFAQAGVK